MRPTVLASSVISICTALGEQGIDAGGLLERVGLDASQLNDPDARFPDPAVMRLWAIAARQSEDPCFGLRVARHVHPGHLQALGYAWLASATLRDALERLTRYQKMILDSDAESYALEPRAQGWALTINVSPSSMIAPIESYDCLIAAIVLLCRVSYGEEFAPRQLSLKRPKPPCAGDFFELFRCPIDFGAAHDTVLFGAAELDHRLPTANAELAHANDRVVRDYLARLDHSAITLQVRARLVDLLSAGQVTEQTVAECLGIGTRTLQRKLAAEDTSFKDILDETRRELATQYMSNSRLSITEVSYLLGFAEPTNFSRAFRRWTGKSPSDFRESA